MTASKNQGICLQPANVRCFGGTQAQNLLQAAHARLRQYTSQQPHPSTCLYTVTLLHRTIELPYKAVHRPEHRLQTICSSIAGPGLRSSTHDGSNERRWCYLFSTSTKPDKTDANQPLRRFSHRMRAWCIPYVGKAQILHIILLLDYGKGFVQNSLEWMPILGTT